MWHEDILCRIVHSINISLSSVAYLKFTDLQRIFVLRSSGSIHEFDGNDHRLSFVVVYLYYSCRTEKFSAVLLDNRATGALCRLLICRSCGILKQLYFEITAEQNWESIM
jgi:hypothetical protein